MWANQVERHVQDCPGESLVTVSLSYKDTKILFVLLRSFYSGLNFTLVSWLEIKTAYTGNHKMPADPKVSSQGWGEGRSTVCNGLYPSPTIPTNQATSPCPQNIQSFLFLPLLNIWPNTVSLMVMMINE